MKQFFMRIAILLVIPLALQLNGAKSYASESNVEFDPGELDFGDTIISTDEDDDGGNIEMLMLRMPRTVEDQDSEDRQCYYVRLSDPDDNDAFYDPYDGTERLITYCNTDHDDWSIGLAFKPTEEGDQDGEFEAKVWKHPDNPDNSSPFETVSVKLSGKGTPNYPKANVSTNSLSFGNVELGKELTKTFTIKNETESVYFLFLDCKSSLTNFGVFPSTKTFDTCKNPGMSIDAGKTVDFKVVFKPTTEGSINETIKFATNSYKQKTIEIKLSGTGVAPAATSFNAYVQKDPRYRDSNGEYNPTWDWTLKAEGDTKDFPWKISVNTNCNGHGDNHGGNFNWEIESLYGASSLMFGNGVEKEWVKEPLKSMKAKIVGKSGTVIFEGDVNGPECYSSLPPANAQGGNGQDDPADNTNDNSNDNNSNNNSNNSGNDQNSSNDNNESNDNNGDNNNDGDENNTDESNQSEESDDSKAEIILGGLLGKLTGNDSNKDNGENKETGIIAGVKGLQNVYESNVANDASWFGSIPVGVKLTIIAVILALLSAISYFAYIAYKNPKELEKYTSKLDIIKHYLQNMRKIALNKIYR